MAKAAKKEAPNNLLAAQGPNVVATASTIPAPAPIVAPTVADPKAKKPAYRVFSDRMATVAQVYDEDEARTLAVQFNGSYKQI